MKRVFISGASRGIGLECARKFVENGHEVIICARGEENLQAAKMEIPELITYTCDISKKEEVKALAFKIRMEHGPIDVLVNNGGIYIPGEVWSEPDEAYEQLIAVNLHSAVYFTKAFIADMVERKSGTIINMCSIASIMPYGGTYSITKYALLGFSKNLRNEMKDKGIRVIAILPGATYTSSWEGSGLPAERMMPAEDIAEVVWTAYNLSARTVVEEVILRPQLGDI
ncbi:MAG: SDR family oxidoreductase [Bacteroidia bacterium]|nr:SDR family oxidoreductase [Bacteroidia bacterium]